MSQKFDHINASEPVSTVTKHIKIYSDNPIHDCIDRIIDAVAYIDEDHDWMGSQSGKLQEAAEDLLILACDLRKQANDKIRKRLNAEKRN